MKVDINARELEHLIGSLRIGTDVARDLQVPDFDLYEPELLALQAKLEGLRTE